MSLLRALLRSSSTSSRHADTWHRLQQEAAARPESKLVQTPSVGIWLSPIESKLHEAMVTEGLSPVPQYCIQGYFADFAFPDVRLAVEADGRAFHSGEARSRDSKRDWILKNAGWSVKRFHGTTIHAKAGNCAFVVKREVEAVRAAGVRRAKERYLANQRRREAVTRPFRWLVGMFPRGPKGGAGRPSAQKPP